MADIINFAAMLAEAGPELEEQIAQDQDKSGLYKLVPAGKYRAQIVKAEPVPTSSNGNEGTKITWKIIEGEQTGRLVYETVRYVFSSEKGRITFFRKFASRGLDTKFFANNPTQAQIEAALNSMGDRTSVVSVKHEAGRNDSTRMWATVSWVDVDHGQKLDAPAARPATASGAFGGVPTTAQAPSVPTPVLGSTPAAAPVIPTPVIPTPTVSGTPVGL